jgi:hypothetical protein
MWIQIQDLFYPGSGIKKFGSGIQYKHPGSASLDLGKEKNIGKVLKNGILSLNFKMEIYLKKKFPPVKCLDFNHPGINLILEMLQLINLLLNSRNVSANRPHVIKLLLTLCQEV